MRDLESVSTQSLSTSLASKTFVLLTLSTAMSALGAWVGFGLTAQPVLMFGCLIAQFVGLFVLRSVREKTGLAITVLAGWMVLSGITTGVVVNSYVADLGMNTVIGGFLGTVAVMAICGVIASVSGINFKPLEKGMSIALLALIVVGIASWFMQFSPAINMLYSGIGMVVFAGFFLIDFYRLAKSQSDSWPDAIFVTVNIYLDFINFFFFLLRFLRGNR